MLKQIEFPGLLPQVFLDYQWKTVLAVIDSVQRWRIIRLLVRFAACPCRPPPTRVADFKSH